MRNILRISASDMKRIWTNVVAVVVVIGLSVIPCLYAWFNILSNWDPYGPDATKNLQVAVVSCDEGVSLAGIELNVGDMIIENLEANTTIGWVFSESMEEALNAVEAGDCYAALVVDETFSEKIVSFLGGKIENPEIHYYVNEKKNAIAPKITNKVKNTIQEEVNKAFVGKIAEVLMKVSDFIVDVDEDGNINSYSMSKLEDLDTDLLTYISVLDSYIALLESTDTMMESASAMTNQMESMMKTVKASASGIDASMDGLALGLTQLTDEVYEKLDRLNSGLLAIEELIDFIRKNAGQSDVVNSRVDKMMQEDLVYLKTLRGNLNEINPDDSLIVNLDAAIDALEQIGRDKTELNTYTSEKWDVISEKLKVCRSDISAIKDSYRNDVQPKLKASISELQAAVNHAQSILNVSTSNLDIAVAAIKNYPNGREDSKQSLIQSRDEALETEETIRNLIDALSNVSGQNKYALILAVLKSDPVSIADFISNPVTLETEAIYGIENNGSAASAFYIVLSIWVGSLIMSTILKTNVKPIDGVKNPKNYEKFIGRYVVTFLIGQIQTIITVLGALLFCQIQCPHPFLLILAGSWTSFIFSLLLYSLTYSFGSVGEALSVILMVIQVAGSGGTFPIEVLPTPFRLIYNYMPFMYSMNAMRECIGGMYKYDYWKYMSGLAIYIVVALFIGMILYFPCVKLNEIIEESKEKTDLLI